jgi:hypothetical protein
MKLVVGVAGIVFILFLLTSVAAQISVLSQAVAPQIATTQYDSGDPTPEEQLVLEYINRARADPWAEGVRLRDDANYLWENLPNATGPSAVGVRPPLAMSKALLLSARFHNDDMYNNSFFGHQDMYYGSISRRLLAFGYRFWDWGENIAGWGSVTAAEDMLMIDGDCLNPSACGHRINLFDPNFEEVGIGWLATSRYLTQDFGLQNPMPAGNTGPFLVGVVYNDMNGNNFYDIGEGISGVMITPDTGTYYAVSSTSGGYALPIPTEGTITVTASGSGLGSISKTVTLAGANIKLDFTLQDYSKSSTTTSTSQTQTTTSSSETQTITSTSETQATTSFSETHTSASTSETQTTTSIGETWTTTSTSQTRGTTSTSKAQTTTSSSETQTTMGSSETQSATSTSETQTITSSSETEITTSTGETQTTTSIGETQATTSTGEAETTTVEASVTSPTSITSIVAAAQTTTSVTLSLPLSAPRCVIATATFGSVLAPEVVYMRYVRDQLIGSTPSGRTLIEAFNMFYYAWSPAVAEVIAGNELLRAVFRVILLPLLGIVHISAVIFRTVALVTGQTDQASVFAFLGAAVMTISVYVALPIAAVAKSKQTIRGLLARFHRSGP